MKLVVMMKKSTSSENRLRRLMERRGDTPDKKLEYFRGLILGHLSGLEKEGDEDGVPKAVQKVLNLVEIIAKGGKGLPVGTVRDWKGKKYVKIATGKWRPKYDGETRGAKMAVSAIKRKIAEAKDAQTMLQIVLENRDRFSDKNGNPLPFVEELSKYVAERGDAIEAAGKTVRGQFEPSRKNAEKKIMREKSKTDAAPEKPGTNPKRAKELLLGEIRKRVKDNFEAMAVPLEKIEFTRENYDKLFPTGGVIKTPLGDVKMGKHQFEKLEARDREYLLGALKPTLTDPIVVIESNGAKLYAKSFAEDENTKAVISIVVSKDGQEISISSHRRGISNIVNKINGGNILYEKNVAPDGSRARDSKNQDNVSAETTPNTISGGGSLKTGDRSQPSTVSPGSEKKSSGRWYEGWGAQGRTA